MGGGSRKAKQQKKKAKGGGKRVSGNPAKRNGQQQAPAAQPGSAFGLPTGNGQQGEDFELPPELRKLFDR
jgi:signal recognition particle subunit SRP54